MDLKTKHHCFIKTLPKEIQEKCYSILAPREKDVMRLLYEGRTYKQVGQLFYCSIERIRQVEQRAFRKFKQHAFCLIQEKKFFNLRFDDNGLVFTAVNNKNIYVEKLFNIEKIGTESSICELITKCLPFIDKFIEEDDFWVNPWRGI